LSSEEEEKEEKGNEVFTTVTCDECKKCPIKGIWYKCISCPNYDLCMKCEKKGKHNHHDLLKIRKDNKDYEVSEEGSTLVLKHSEKKNKAAKVNELLSALLL